VGGVAPAAGRSRCDRLPGYYRKAAGQLQVRAAAGRRQSIASSRCRAGPYSGRWYTSTSGA